jgi:hypothetical protein
MIRIAACIAAASLLPGCTSIGWAVGSQCAATTYESDACHANGTPVTDAERVERKERHIAECRHLSALLGDRALTRMQNEVARTEWNTRRCSSSEFVP